jgi:hypothetical protein
MTDDERIKRIDRIYDDMEDKYAFSQRFCGNANQISLLRSDDVNQFGLLKALE